MVSTNKIESHPIDITQILLKQALDKRKIAGIGPLLVNLKGVAVDRAWVARSDFG
jgi:hypothetical protein